MMGWVLVEIFARYSLKSGLVILISPCILGVLCMIQSLGGCWEREGLVLSGLFEKCGYSEMFARDPHVLLRGYH